MDRVFLWVISHYPGNVSLWSLKIEGVLWSTVDVFLLLGFLKIFGLARARRRQRRIIFRFLLLWVSAFLIPLLLFVRTHAAFLMVDYPISNIHLVILVYTVVADGRSALVLFKAALRRSPLA